MSPYHSHATLHVGVVISRLGIHIPLLIKQVRVDFKDQQYIGLIRGTSTYSQACYLGFAEAKILWEANRWRFKLALCMRYGAVSLAACASQKQSTPTVWGLAYIGLYTRAHKFEFRVPVLGLRVWGLWC